MSLAHRRHPPSALVAALVCACVCALAGAWTWGAPAARAASPGSAVILDCNKHNALTGHYSIKQLQDALNHIPADIRAYSACYQIIQRQLLVEEGKATSGGGSGQVSTSSGGSSLPTALIVVIVVLLLAAATFGAVAIRRRRGGG